MENRQQQLEQGFIDRTGKRQPGFWQTYIQKGARVMRHDGSIDSARRIVDNIITRSTPIYVQVQNEVNAGKDLSQTAAGQAIKTDLEKAAEKAKEELTSLKAEMEDALKNAKEDRDRLQQHYEEQMAALGRRMAAESEEQKRRTQEELNNLQRQMADALRHEKEQQDQLRAQYQEDISSAQATMRAQYEEQRKLMDADNLRLREEITRMASQMGRCCNSLVCVHCCIS